MTARWIALALCGCWSTSSSTSAPESTTTISNKVEVDAEPADTSRYPADHPCNAIKIGRGRPRCAGALVGTWDEVAYYETGPDEYRFELHADGRVTLNDAKTGPDASSAKSGTGTWKPRGDRLEIVINDYSCIVAACGSGELSGEGHNRDGLHWTWKATRSP